MKSERISPFWVGGYRPFSTKIMISDVPKDSDSTYMKTRKHELFRKRAGIEPVIGHCKSDHRLGRNFYKGLFGDSINVMLAAAAFNLKRAMRLFFGSSDISSDAAVVQCI